METEIPVEFWAKMVKQTQTIRRQKQIVWVCLTIFTRNSTETAHFYKISTSEN